VWGKTTASPNGCGGTRLKRKKKRLRAACFREKYIDSEEGTQRWPRGRIDRLSLSVVWLETGCTQETRWQKRGRGGAIQIRMTEKKKVKGEEEAFAHQLFAHQPADDGKHLAALEKEGRVTQKTAPLRRGFYRGGKGWLKWTREKSEMECGYQVKKLGRFTPENVTRTVHPGLQCGVGGNGEYSGEGKNRIGWGRAERWLLNQNTGECYKQQLMKSLLFFDRRSAKKTFAWDTKKWGKISDGAWTTRSGGNSSRAQELREGWREGGGKKTPQESN